MSRHHWTKNTFLLLNHISSIFITPPMIWHYMASYIFKISYFWSNLIEKLVFYEEICWLVDFVDMLHTFSAKNTCILIKNHFIKLIV